MKYSSYRSGGYYFKRFFGALTLLIFTVKPAYPGFQEDLHNDRNEAYQIGKILVSQKQPILPGEKLAKAVPDECFFGVYTQDLENPDAIPENPNVFDPKQKADCDHNKVNQAYIWGMVKTGDTLWFGTGPNVHCLVSASYLGLTELGGEGIWVCEFGDSQYIPNLLNEIPALSTVFTGNDLIDLTQVGDWRPPQIFVYNISTKTLSEKTPTVTPLGMAFDYPETLANATLGIRSAGALNNIVLLAGPSGTGGIDLYAYNTSTGYYLGSSNLSTLPGESLSAINNIRKWLVVDGVLYTTVGVTYADGTTTGGKVLRWRGNLLNPFQFEVVGTLDSAGAELAVHEGRLFISTWSGGGEMGVPDEGNAPAGLYMSPIVPSGGFTAQHKDQWVKVWEVSDYEPCPLIAKTYGGGALASFGEYLYWGTMHVPYLSYVTVSEHLRSLSGSLSQVYFPDVGTRKNHYVYDRTTYRNPRNDLMNNAVRRGISLFRGKHFGQTDEEIQLLYGRKELPVVDVTPDTVEDETILEGYNSRRQVDYIARFVMTPNNMGGAEPLFGPSGFGNEFNNYTWAMAVFQNQLYVGTMNHAMLLFQGDVPDDDYMAPSMGANLFRFPNTSSPAIAESVDGLGNFSSYGIRTMVSDDALYLGMANPMNLLKDENGKNLGGWELIKLGKWSYSASGSGKIEVDVASGNGAPYIDTIQTFSDSDSGVNQTGKPVDERFQDGLVALTVKNLAAPGGTVQVTLTLPGTYSAGAKYYKTTENGFEEFKNADGMPRYVFNGHRVTLTLTDGDRWDRDGLVNGEILDPGGAAQVPATGSSGSSSSGCFISGLL